MVLGRFLGSVALALALAVVAGGSAAPAQTPNAGGGTSACVQRCFDQYILNAYQCYCVHCDPFCFRLLCNQSGLHQCLGNAQRAYEFCVAGC